MRLRKPAICWPPPRPSRRAPVDCPPTRACRSYGPGPAAAPRRPVPAALHPSRSRCTCLHAARRPPALIPDRPGPCHRYRRSETPGMAPHPENTRGEARARAHAVDQRAEQPLLQVRLGNADAADIQVPDEMAVRLILTSPPGRADNRCWPAPAVPGERARWIRPDHRPASPPCPSPTMLRAAAGSVAGPRSPSRTRQRPVRPPPDSSPPPRGPARGHQSSAPRLDTRSHRTAGNGRASA